MPSFLDSLVGKKPQVPTLPQLDLATEQQKAAQGNLAVLPQAEQLAGKANLFSQAQIDAMLKSAIPGYGGMQQSTSNIISSELQGQIPLDVQQQIQNSDAARSLGAGTSGTGIQGNLVARDLGLTSLGLTQQGINSFEQWQKTAASIYEPSMMNVQSMFVSPAQQASFDTQERNMQFQRNWLQSQINSMPAPWAEDLKQFVYRALSAYSGTPVQSNPYSTPGSFGGGLGGGGGAMPGSAGYGEPGPVSTTFVDNTGGSNDFGGELTAGAGAAETGGAVSFGGFGF